ncbi:unnamed protein product, partial [Medioppia subpectinata]
MSGPNGTGKTTLMRVILGQLKLTSGKIKVFENKPGSVGSGIPGPGVGYMPQELALFDYFTIGEILNYYGMIYHMTREEIDESVNNLREILHLPKNSRLISQLNGGQQRRVSIAITMLHKPRLVILDEPTVGVDSLLRHRIWQYLKDMCEKYGQTVIITTHYIEEARSAHNVAFMRSGAVLRQSNPQQLMDEYECPTLEDVFLQLCHLNDNNVALSQDLKSNNNTNNGLNNKILTTSEIKIYYKNNLFVDWQRMKAMLIKQWIAIKSRPLFVCAYYCLIIISMTSLHLIFGQDIKHMPVGVYNSNQIDVNQTSLSNLIIDSINPQNMRLTHYPSIDSAVQSVTNGDNYLALEFRDNFSDSFEMRVTEMFDASDDVVEQSLIHLYVDISNPQMYAMMVRYLLEGFVIFSKKLGQIVNNMNIYDQMNAIRVIEVFNGDLCKPLATFMFVGPQLMIFVEFSWGLILSAFIMISDKSSNIMNRVFAAGVTEYEYMGAHIFINVIINLVQVICAMIVVFVAFTVQQSGSYWEIFLFLFMENMAGTFIGLLLAVIFGDPFSVIVCVMGLIFPLLFISGIFWPLEAIPHMYRFINYINPVTYPIQSIRNIMARGWTYQHPDVYYGYLINITIIVVSFLLSLALFKRNSNKYWSINKWLK